MSIGYPKDVIKDLIDGKLPWEMTKNIMSSPKDDDRFMKVLEIEQERVPWPEKIIMPYAENLYIVEKGKERIVKCICGHEFGDYRINWKDNALIYIRDTAEKLEEIFPGPRKCNPEWMHIREYYCPTCGILLEVENLPLGYPIIFDFLPDLD